MITAHMISKSVNRVAVPKYSEKKIW